MRSCMNRASASELPLWKHGNRNRTPRVALLLSYFVYFLHPQYSVGIMCSSFSQEPSHSDLLGLPAVASTARTVRAVLLRQKTLRGHQIASLWSPQHCLCSGVQVSPLFYQPVQEGVTFSASPRLSIPPSVCIDGATILAINSNSRKQEKQIIAVTSRWKESQVPLPDGLSPSEAPTVRAVAEPREGYRHH